MKKIWSLLPWALILSGCEMFATKPPEPTVKVVKEAVELAIYQPPDPAEMQLDGIKWIVITKENLNQKIPEVEKLTGQGFVIMAITPKDYENLANNIQELRRYIREQRAIILYYKNVTKTSEGWAEINDKKQAEQRRQFEETKH